MRKDRILLMIMVVLIGIAFAGKEAFAQEVDKDELKPALHKDDAQMFSEVMKQRGLKQQKRLKYLKKMHPEKYGEIKGRIIQHRLEKLKQLKEKNPEKFRQFIRLRKKHLNKKLRYLKEKNPQKFEQLKAHVHKQRVERLKKLRWQDPEKFKQVMKKRKEIFQAHLQKLKDEDPEKFKRIQKRIAIMQEYNQLRQEDPAQALEFLSKHPKLKMFIKKRGFILATDD